MWPHRPLSGHVGPYMRAGIPRVFSLIENPAETLDFIQIFRNLLEYGNLKNLDLDYTGCEKLDLCASVVLDVLAIRAKRQKSFRNRKIRFSGTFTSRPEINLMLRSSGMLKHLGSAMSRNIPPSQLERLRFSELRQGKASLPEFTSETELAASELAEFFDTCLVAEGHRLKRAWKGNLIQLITEVLDNAEEHGSGSKIWYTIGYYNKDEDAAEGGECHIVIFNFGESIYATLNRPDTSEDLKSQISELAREHQRKGYFAVQVEHLGILFPIWQEESLWTLYALQEGVSRFRNKPEGIDRGNGTVKLIEFFSELASGEPRMAILSGKTHILFDGRYWITPVEVGSETRKIIAFNDANDLNIRPDERYVRTLASSFPGTLVSLRFQLKQTELANIKEKLDADSPNH
jgi:hypothetical protein